MRKLPLFLLLFFSFVAHGQEPGNDSISIFDLTLDDLYNIQVTSASKTSESLGEAAATIYVITRQQIDIRNYTSLAQLLYDIPRIIIQWKSSSEKEHIYSVNGITGCDKFLVLLDGVRINSAIGTDHTIYEAYSLENVKQVEVILGPASAIYGADAFSGVVNIITYDAKDNPGVNYNLSYGQFNTYRASVGANKVMGDLQFSLSAKLYHTDEPFYPKYYPKEYSWYNIYAQTGKVISWYDTIVAPVGIQPWDASVDSYNFRLRWKYKNFTWGFASFFEGHSSSISGKPEKSVYFDKAVYDNQLSTVYLKYSTSSKNKKFNYNSVLSAQQFKILPNSAFVNIFTDFYLAYKYENAKAVKWENILRYKPKPGNQFSLSLTAEWFDVIPKTGDLPVEYDERIPVDSQRIYYFGSNIKDYQGNDLTVYQDFYHLKYASFGGFGQYKHAFADKVFLTAGGRFDYDTRYGKNVNPRLGLVYMPNKKFKFKLLYGHAYLAPSPHVAYQHFGAFRPVYDSLGRVTGLTSGFFRLTNPDLKPEKLKTTEFDFVYRISEPLSFKANFFYTQLHDYISWEIGKDTTFKGVHVDTYRLPVNRGVGETYGFTTGFEYLWHIKETVLMFDTYYSYIDGQIEDKPLLYTSRHNIKSTFTVNIRDLIQLYFSAHYRHYSYYGTGPGEYSPPFVYTYFSANYRIMQKKNYSMTVFGKISNVFNQKYYNATDGTFGRVPQDPIRAELGLKFSLF